MSEPSASVGRFRAGVTTQLIPSGALNDEARIQGLRGALDSCVEADEIHVVLDLARVPLVNSAALEVLFDAYESLARQGGSLAVANANGAVRDVFRLTGLATMLSLGDSGVSGIIARRTVQSIASSRRIGEILLEREFVSEETIERALKIQAESGRRMAQVMVEQGWLEEKKLLEALSEQLGVPFIHLRTGLYDPETAALMEADASKRLGVLPLFRVRGVLYLATADPQSIPTIDTVEDLTGSRVEPVLACSDAIHRTLEEAYGETNDLSEFVGDLEEGFELVERAEQDQGAIDEMAEASPIVNLLNGIIQRAVRDRASDIHIEASRTKCRVRFRIDGVLYTAMTPPIEVHPALVSRLKVMAKLDIAERRLPQDGRIQVATQGRTVDLRFSSLPGIFGEKIVLRVLDRNEAILDVNRLGLREDNHARLLKLLKRSYGLLLVTGPTGSGKTTTLYAGLNHLNSDEKNIVTIEDPVEYQIDTITQNQVRENIDLTFARILKHVLRQDPDIIMVGEIRERETAEIAVRAALTGHLVLSTLHTNDSVGAVTRMLDMGIEPFLLASSLVGVVAQRLVRRVCPECATTYSVPADALAEYGVPDTENLRLTRGRGCESCYDSGYQGRIAIHEILECEPGLQELIVSNAGQTDLENYMEAHKVETLLGDGIKRAMAGQTTIEEILRVVNS